LFKDLLQENDANIHNYNPNDNMIDEITAYILVGTLKILKNKTKNFDTKYLPTAFVIKQLNKYMFVSFTLKKMIFDIGEDDDSFTETPEFEEIVEALVDRSLKGGSRLYKNDEIKNEGTGLVLLSNLHANPEQRKEFWSNKLKNLIMYSNRQWLLDQFKYCKWFLFKNSSDHTLEDIPLEVVKLDKYIENMMKKEPGSVNPLSLLKDRRRMTIFSKPQSSNLISLKTIANDTKKPDEKPIKLVPVVNVATLIAEFINTEQEIRYNMELFKRPKHDEKKVVDVNGNRGHLISKEEFGGNNVIAVEAIKCFVGTSYKTNLEAMRDYFTTN
jgi:hypothetical protein